MFYLRINLDDSYEILLDALSEIYVTDVPISEDDYNQYVENISAGKNYKVVNPEGANIFEILGETKREAPVIHKTPIDAIKEAQAKQEADIVTNLNATATLFEMILPTTQTLSRASIPGIATMTATRTQIPPNFEPIVKVYVALIEKGEKTLADVPAIIREYVASMLA